MCFRFIFLIFCLVVFVHCEDGNNNSREELAEKKEENLGSNQSTFNNDTRFSNSRGVINNKDSDRVKTQSSYTSNTGKSEQAAGSITEISFERRTGESHGRENNYESNINKNNNRVTGTGGQLLGSLSMAESTEFSNNKDSGRYPSVQNSFERPNGESVGLQQFPSRPNNQEFSSGRPVHESTNYGQQTDFRPPQNENNFSGRPTEGSSFGPLSGFGSGSAGGPGRPETSGGLAFGQSMEVKPGNEDHFSERPSGSSTSGQSNSIRPASEDYSPGRPFGGSTLGQPGALRPDNKGHSSGRPNEVSGVDHSSSLTQESQTGSATQRPNSNKEEEHSQAGKTPEVEENQGTEDGKEDDKDVCFTHLGCFKMGKPWKSSLRPVGAPDAPEKIQTVIHFYSRQNPKQPQNITVYPQVNMGRAQFDPQKISAMIVHGFSNSGNATWMKEMKDVYLRKVDANVMIVDWGKGAQLLNYLQVAGNTRVVGKELGTFVKYLTEQYGADPGKFHLIGHSLGAQICSYLAKDVPGIARLTALDPAQPGFEGFSKEVRLDQTDAEFVDVIHTDARPFIPTLGFGMIAPHGHVDFYMNGGFDQPGCVPPPKKDLPVIKSFLDFAKFPVEAIAKIVACPHARAYEYLIEAFNETDNCIFWGHKTDVKNVFKTVTNTVTQGLFKKFTALSTTCSKDDCIPLGFATKKSPLRGAFVVTTSGRPPYCISEPGVPPETLPEDREKKSVIEKIKETPILG